MLPIVASLLLQIAAAQPPELIRDPVVLDFCRLLIRKATTERSREQGAFVVRTADGTLYFVVWPPSEEKDMLRWHGRFPDGTIAIVHTHPPWLPAPSKLDMRAARGARVPVYVLTVTSISKTTGDGSEVVLERDWAR